MTKEELERKIASIRGCHRVDLAKLKARTEQVARLKKENAELKERADKADLDSVLFFNQLCKAKEIIKKLYSHVFQGIDFMELNDYNIQKAEVEQFLKENA